MILNCGLVMGVNRMMKMMLVVVVVMIMIGMNKNDDMIIHVPLNTVQLPFKSAYK
jgi:hypothetical protein